MQQVMPLFFELEMKFFKYNISEILYFKKNTNNISNEQMLSVMSKIVEQKCKDVN